MTFADLLAGDMVFVDANVLIYHFAPHPLLGPACHQLIQRIETISFVVLRQLTSSANSLTSA